MLYLLLKAFHIIAMVAWFAGLFYLPRLFVYHSQATDEVSIERFKIMEWRLYYAITYPAAVITTILGISLLTLNWHYYMTAGWMHAKLTLIIALWTYHLFCGRYLKHFYLNQNRKSEKFYRVFNELPTVLLVGIVICVVVRPF